MKVVKLNFFKRKGVISKYSNQNFIDSFINEKKVRFLKKVENGEYDINLYDVGKLPSYDTYIKSIEN